jgi:hypothetical protein
MGLRKTIEENSMWVLSIFFIFTGILGSVVSLILISQGLIKPSILLIEFPFITLFGLILLGDIFR